MHLSEEARKGVEKLAAEGRVSERGVVVGPGLVALPQAVDEIGEKEFQWAVIGLAERCGWLVYHTFDSRRSKPGFTDLVLVRERVLFVECKDYDGRLTEAQCAWRDALLAAKADWRLWRPQDWAEIVNTLGGVS